MNYAESNAESIIEILTAQCRDLESLLKLAHEQAIAAEKSDFDEILRVTTDRARLGERLEVYHRQIDEMRRELDRHSSGVFESEPVKRTLELIQEIQLLDSQTGPKLLATRHRLIEEGQKLNHASNGIRAYHGEQRRSALGWDQTV
jgi:prefoldin subunit 5